jgi:hypothetical protein
LLRGLVDEGFRVTAGALHLLDTDAETAESLGVVAAVEGPFAPLSEETRAHHRVLLGEAHVIVVAAFAVGPSNLANLEDVVPFARRTPVVVVDPLPDTSLDFTGGAATAAREALRSAGATFVPDPEAAVRAVTKLLSEPRAAPPTAAAQG